MKNHLKLISWLFTMILLSGPLNAGQADLDLEKLMERVWTETIEASPLSASMFGETRYQDRVDDLSPEAFERRVASLDTALAELKDIDPDQLSEDNRVNYEVFDWMLRNERRTLDFDAHLFTFNTIGGWQTNFASLPARTTFFRETHYRDYLKRLVAFGTYADQNMALMKRGIEQGYTQPCEVLEGYENSISGYLPDGVEESAFYEPFDQMPDGIPAGVQSELRNKGKQVISDVVLPAYERYLAFYTDQYKPACRTEVGLSSVVRGRELYDHWVSYYTTMPTNADSVHALGLAEVKRIKEQMLDVIAETGFEGSFAEFLHFMRTDPQFYETDPEKYMAVAALIAKRVDGMLPQYFSYLPRLPYGLTPIPDAIAPKATTAFYQPGNADGTRAGQYYINLHDLPSRPLYELPALTVHEAVPGHHLQFAIQGEMNNLPRFRQQYYFHAYGEGWGLYTELLGVEMGIYRTPYDHFGRLTYEMWRAARLVVDTGMHAMGWTRQEAIDGAGLQTR
jgi:uncharacterized protein (DUF885 family)